MNDLKVIFVNWTKPFFYKNDAEGYNRLKMSDLSDIHYDIIDYELLIQKVAVLNAKKYIGKTKLYTDDIGYQFYKNQNMLDFWDEIDTDTLNKFDEDYSHVRPGKFWTTGKSIVIGKQTEPFLFLDLDFIVRENLPDWVYQYDLVHTHWEIQRGDWFVYEKQINDIGGVDDFVQNMLMPNTSFLYIRNMDLCKDYLKKHLQIIERDYDEVREWLWLIADQGIMGYSARKLKLKVESLENNIYLSYHEFEPNVGRTPFWVRDPNRKPHEKYNYEHVWFNKYALKINQEYRNIKTTELNKELMELLKHHNI